MERKQAQAVIYAAWSYHEGNEGDVMSSPVARRAVEAAFGNVPIGGLEQGSEASKRMAQILRTLADAIA